ncbi:MAG: polyprenyl synthetase family protein, partial [Bacteroidales bacterium]|nr:polyprenyl synthetase family protein [Bacteroidales bacterium]
MMHSESEVSQIKQSLHPFLQRVECLIEESLHSDVGLLDSVNRFLRERPGKMMRPMLAILCAGACGSVGEDTLSFAAAAELLHNATLLHDDVVDD